MARAERRAASKAEKGLSLLTRNRPSARIDASARREERKSTHHPIPWFCLLYTSYKAIDRFLIFGDKGSIEFPYYDNAAPLVLETIAGDPENAIAHEGVMGGVRCLLYTSMQSLFERLGALLSKNHCTQEHICSHKLFCSSTGSTKMVRCLILSNGIIS